MRVGGQAASTAPRPREVRLGVPAERAARELELSAQRHGLLALRPDLHHWRLTFWKLKHCLKACLTSLNLSL